MGKYLIASILICSIIILSNCAGQIMTPANVPYYAVGKTAWSAEYHDHNYKMGKACATSYLGVVGTGDASIAAAANQGGIRSVMSVSHETKGIMGFFADVCTVVRGY